MNINLLWYYGNSSSGRHESWRRYEKPPRAPFPRNKNGSSDVTNTCLQASGGYGQRRSGWTKPYIKQLNFPIGPRACARARECARLRARVPTTENLLCKMFPVASLPASVRHEVALRDISAPTSGPGRTPPTSSSTTNSQLCLTWCTAARRSPGRNKTR